MVNNDKFLGHGSPEALEKAITAEENEHFVVGFETLCYAGVCSDLPQEEVEARMARRISGTSGGWKICEDTQQGVPCQDKPGFKHYLFEC